MILEDLASSRHKMEAHSECVPTSDARQETKANKKKGSSAFYWCGLIFLLGVSRKCPKSIPKPAQTHRCPICSNYKSPNPQRCQEKAAFDGFLLTRLTHQCLLWILRRIRDGICPHIPWLDAFLMGISIYIYINMYHPISSNGNILGSMTSYRFVAKRVVFWTVLRNRRNSHVSSRGRRKGSDLAGFRHE